MLRVFIALAVLALSVQGALWTAQLGELTKPQLAQTQMLGASTTWTKQLSKGSYGTVDVGQTAFNTAVQKSQHHIVKRECSSCGSDYQTMYIRRYTQTDSWDSYDSLKQNWFSQSNTLNSDFGIFSTYQEAVDCKSASSSCTGAWKFCNYDDPGIGFPRDCGKTGAVGNQWNSWTRGGKDVAYYTEAAGYTILSSHTYNADSNKYSGIGTITLSENTDVSALAVSGTNGGALKDDVYLSMTVVLSSAAYYPTTFELCPVNNNNGIMLTLKSVSGTWASGSNKVLMNLKDLGTGIYKGTPQWTNLNRLEMYMNEKNADTSATIKLEDVKFEQIDATGAPSVAATAAPTVAPSSEALKCHCTNCHGHYDVTKHIEYNAAQCGSWCETDSNCKFSLHDAERKKCYKYNSAKTIASSNGDARYTCYHK